MLLYYSTRRKCIVCLSSLVVLTKRSLLEWGKLFSREVLWCVGNFPAGGGGWGAVFLAGNYPGGNFPRGQLSGHLLNGYTSVSLYSRCSLCSHYVHIAQKLLCVAQKTMLCNKKIFHIEVTLRTKIMWVTKKYTAATKKFIWHPKERLVLTR